MRFHGDGHRWLRISAHERGFEKLGEMAKAERTDPLSGNGENQRELATAGDRPTYKPFEQFSEAYANRVPRLSMRIQDSL